MNVFGEGLITLLKEDHFKKLDIDFKVNFKKSINRQQFIKTLIKEMNLNLNASGNLRSYGQSGYKDVYDDLIKGDREKYFQSIHSLRLAGETEAIILFLENLENLKNIDNKKNITKQFNNSFSKDLLPIEIFDYTRNYLKKNAIQVNICYRYKAFDACSILLRKITEILIIEVYEKFKMEYKIENEEGNNFTLSKLIKCFQNEVKFRNILSRNMKEALSKIKRNGDLSAHSRKYNSTKNDIDKISDDFRILFQELVNTIYH